MQMYILLYRTVCSINFMYSEMYIELRFLTDWDIIVPVPLYVEGVCN